MINLLLFKQWLDNFVSQLDSKPELRKDLYVLVTELLKHSEVEIKKDSVTIRYRKELG